MLGLPMFDDRVFFLFIVPEQIKSLYVIVVMQSHFLLPFFKAYAVR